MKKAYYILLLLMCCKILSAQGRMEIPFNSAWEFKMSKADKDEVLAESQGWKKVNIPHDYSMELGFIPPVGEKDHPENFGDLGLILGSRSTGYIPSGVGWYRKNFTLPDKSRDKNVQVLFDGVYRMSDVWINGHHLGFQNNGYVAFYYDLSPYLNEGNNTLVVRTNNELKSRWYSGSGIYRDVKLLLTDKTHIPIWGVYITTSTISPEKAELSIETRVKNERDTGIDITIVHNILDSSQKKVAQLKEIRSIKSHEELVVSSTIQVDNPKLWDIDSPNLYNLVTEVHSGMNKLDNLNTRFGIRSLEFSVEKGFLLNGKPRKLKGACIHHAHGLLGAESYARSEERKILALKEMGCNAIRCAHNPPSKTFLDLCDKYGMLIINEAFDEWKRSKTNGGYSVFFDDWWEKDLTAMLLRDRNHPSIIMWSIGNEIPEQGYPEEGPEIARLLSAHVKTLDKTRPTTLAAQPGTTEMWGNRFPPAAYFDAVDIAGYNYEPLSIKQGGGFVENHKEFPDRIMYQSESRLPEFYDNWEKVLEHSYVLGDFIWTGIDYLGEVGCGYDRKDQSTFPTYFAMCGDLDICMNRKPRSFYRNIIWSDVDDVYIHVLRPEGTGYDNPHKWAFTPGLHSWDWDVPEGKLMKVDVISAADEVELFHNGKSLGKKTPERVIASWDVPYIKGELKAVSYKGGKKTGTDILITPGQPDKLVLKADRNYIKADISEVVYLNFEIIGEKGTRNFLADREVEFEVEGPAEIAGIGTANPKAPLDYSFHGTKCKTFEGRGQLILRSDGKEGKIKIQPRVAGLKTNPVIITAK